MGKSSEEKKWQHRIERKQAETEALVHQTKKVRCELHKVRERNRAAAENEKFQVQRAIATFHKQENKSLDELERVRSARATKELELAALQEQQVRQRDRHRQQRAELEAELEARLVPMREENRRLADAMER